MISVKPRLSIGNVALRYPKPVWGGLEGGPGFMGAQVIPIPAMVGVVKRSGETVYARVPIYNQGQGAGNWTLLLLLYDAAAGNLTNYNSILNLGTSRMRQVRYPSSGTNGPLAAGVMTEAYVNLGTVPIGSVKKYNCMVFLDAYDTAGNKLDQATYGDKRLITNAVEMAAAYPALRLGTITFS